MCLFACFRLKSNNKKKKSRNNDRSNNELNNARVYAISSISDNSNNNNTKMGVSSAECVVVRQAGASSGHHQSNNNNNRPHHQMSKQQQHHHHNNPCHCCNVVVPAVHHQHQHQVVAQNHHHQSHHHHHQHQHQHIQQQQQQSSGKHHHHHHHHHHHNHHANNTVQEVLVTPQLSNSGSDGHKFSPLKGKMKVLKKLKKKMGLGSLAPRSSNAVTNNLPPLTFHTVHGDNIRLCNGNTIARRQESFCKGVTFSARPVRVGEKVCVKFLEISDNWSGVIRFGFTSNDPINLRTGLPRYACPDLTNKPGYWAKALAERYAERDTVLFYYVTSAGEVHFGVNGEEKGVFFGGVETRSALWAIIDVYGNSTAIEFVDPNRQHFNNNLRRSGGNSSTNASTTTNSNAVTTTTTTINCSNSGTSSGNETHLVAANEDNAAQLQQLQQQQQQHSRHSAVIADDSCNPSRDVERIIVPSMQTVSIHHEPDVELPGLRFQPQGMLFSPLPFHSTRGRNIRFSNQQCVATRTDTEFCHGYSFTNRPLILGERIVVQILATEPMYVGALALGLTSCDPSRLCADDLPDDSDLLLDRPEYWVVSKDVASSPQPGDEIAFTVSHFGEVQMSKNGGAPTVVMHVDQSLQLWAFVDVYGSTQRVRMLHSRPPCSPLRQRSANNGNGNNSTVVAPVPLVPTSGPAVQSQIMPDVQFKSSVGGGTVLVVNLPPAPVPAQPIYGQTTANTNTMASTGSSTYVEPVSYQQQQQQQQSQSEGPSSSAVSHMQQWREGLQPPAPGQPSECSICYERSIDSVLYMCGHMCMCYTCALQQWRGKGGGHCPLCRATIRDVIRIYRS